MECPPLAAAAAVSIRQRPWTALAWRASQQAEAVHQMLGSQKPEPAPLGQAGMGWLAWALRPGLVGRPSTRSGL